MVRPLRPIPGAMPAARTRARRSAGSGLTPFGFHFGHGYKRFDLNKRALMLSAAAVALLSPPALAAGPTELKTVVTTAQKTSETGDLTIDSGAGITFKSATVPLLTIASSNTVNNGGALTGADQDTQTGVAIDANGLTGSFDNNGSIALGGAGATKKG